MSKFRWKIAQYAEIRWWQNYLKTKPADDYLKWKTNYWNNFLAQIDFSPKPGSAILDAGCGPAGIFINLDNMKVDAVDPLIDHYQEKLQHFKKEKYPSVSFFPVAFEDFMARKIYDTVFCINAINHVSDLDTCMNKIASCLKPGGELVISIDTHNHQFFKYLFRAIQMDILHPHQYDLADYRNMFKKHGFEVVNEVRFEKRFLFDYHVLVCHKK
ncbi:class I SAM-dependent methyltransferase [Mucilaginibacter puniceus]